MALTITPILDPAPLSPVRLGFVPEINYGAAGARLSGLSAFAISRKLSSPCIGAGKGCACGCAGCSSSGSSGGTLTEARPCPCHRSWILVSNVNGAPTTHDCSCMIEESHPMTKPERIAYASSMDESGNVRIVIDR